MKKLLTLMFSFRGKISGFDYFLALISLIIGVVLIAVVIGFITGPSNAEKLMVVILFAMILILTFWVHLAINIKRLRDMGWSPYFVILIIFSSLLIPLIELIWLGLMLSMPTKIAIDQTLSTKG